MTQNTGNEFIEHNTPVEHFDYGIAKPREIAPGLDNIREHVVETQSMTHNINLQSQLQDHLAKLQALEYDFSEPLLEEVSVENNLNTGMILEETITERSLASHSGEETVIVDETINLTEPIQILDALVEENDSRFIHQNQILDDSIFSETLIEHEQPVHVQEELKQSYAYEMPPQEVTFQEHCYPTQVIEEVVHHPLPP